MATRATYEVKPGDSLWAIAKKCKADISGSNINERIETLRKLNGIKGDLIYPKQILILSSYGSSSSGSGNSNTTPTQATITALGLRAEDTTGRDVFATWSWERDYTKNFKYEWLEYIKDEGGWQGKGEQTTADAADAHCFSTFKASDSATKVKFRILPVGDTYKSGQKELQRWTTDKPTWVSKEYDFSKNPPLQLKSAPNVTVKDRTITITYNNVDFKELSATSVRFQIIKNNKSSVHTSDPIKVNQTTQYVTYQWQAEYGAEYKVRACSVNSAGDESAYSEYSDSVKTAPVAPKKAPTCTAVERIDGNNKSIAVNVKWDKVEAATKYRIEYVTTKTDFDNVPTNISSQDTEDERTSIQIVGLTSGLTYYFRVRVIDDSTSQEVISDPSPIATITIGEPPGPPTTWSSSNSAFVGETMELNWIHNTTDGSAQTKARLKLVVNGDSWSPVELVNATTINSGETVVSTPFPSGFEEPWGTLVSYKGELHVKMNTNHPSFRNAKIEWSVATAGITGQFDNNNWSTPRTIHIYEKPTLELSVTSDLDGNNLIDSATNPLTKFPFYIRGEVSLTDHEIQRPIGYYVTIESDESYETVDESGRTKLVSAGDAVYNRYADTSSDLVLEMSADNIDLEPYVNYKVRCVASMSTGLTVEQVFYPVMAEWEETPYGISAKVDVNTDTYTAVIYPACIDANEDLVENITLAVYRREYDGGLTKIASGIPNSGAAVTDPHPALDYARYRIIATDTLTGAVSFYDMPGVPVKCSSIIIQWDEEWENYDTSDMTVVEDPKWSGSFLKLPYNVSVQDDRKLEVAMVTYAGRSRPVSYFGTAIDESSTWDVAIPKDDTETIYALRRLSIWPGNAYVREPSGTGYWAVVRPRFDLKYDALTVSVTFDITRVEGGA